jgi:hypothetical protein
MERFAAIRPAQESAATLTNGSVPQAFKEVSAAEQKQPYGAELTFVRSRSTWPQSL